MTVNVRAGLVSTKELEDMQREGNLKLLTSKQLAKIINLKSDAALRKQDQKVDHYFLTLGLVERFSILQI